MQIHSGKTQLSAFHSSSVTPPPKAPQVDQPAMLTTNFRHIKIPSPTYPGGSNSSVGLTTWKLTKNGRNVPRILNCTLSLGLGNSETFTLLLLLLGPGCSRVHSSELSTIDFAQGYWLPCPFMNPATTTHTKFSKSAYTFFLQTKA